MELKHVSLRGSIPMYSWKIHGYARDFMFFFRFPKNRGQIPSGSHVQDGPGAVAWVHQGKEESLGAQSHRALGFFTD